MQHRKGLGRQRNGLCPVPQAGIVRVETEAVKAPLRRGHRLIPLVSVDISHWTARDGMYHMRCSLCSIGPGPMRKTVCWPAGTPDHRMARGRQYGGGSLWHYGARASLALMPHLGIAGKLSYPMASQVPRGQGILDTSYHSRRTEPCQDRKNFLQFFYIFFTTTL